MRNYVRLFSIFVLLLICDFTWAAAGEVDMGGIIEQYKATSAKFGSIITKVAMGILLTLFAIEVHWSIVQRWGNVDGRVEDISILSVIGPVLIKNVMRTGFLYWVITGDILRLIVKGFSMLGEQASGQAITSPGDIFFIGVDIANGLTKGMSENLANSTGIVDAALAAMNGVLPALIVGLACFFIILSFMVITAQYAIIQVQLYFFLAIYPLLMAFGATRFGKDFSAKQFSAAIVIGIRLVAIYFVVGVAGGIGDLLESSLAKLSLEDLSPLWAAVGVSGLLGFLALKLPAMASDVVSGSASLSAGDGMAAGSALSAAGGAVGGAAAGALISSSPASGAGGVTPLREAAGSLSGGGISASTGDAFSSMSGNSGLSQSADLSPSFMSGLSPASSAFSGASTIGGGEQSSPKVVGGDGGSGSYSSPSPSSTGANSVDQSSNGGAGEGHAANSISGGEQSSNGGSFAGAGATSQRDEPSVKSIGEAMQQLANEEQSSGGSVQVHMGDD
jgi:type IV secretion system protein TrbL